MLVLILSLRCMAHSCQLLGGPGSVSVYVVPAWLVLACRGTFLIGTLPLSSDLLLYRNGEAGCPRHGFFTMPRS